MRLASWKSVIPAAALALSIAAPSAPAAQDAQTAPAPTPQTATPPPGPASMVSEPPRKPVPLGPNVRLDITITDQSGSDAPMVKTLNTIATDRFNASIRSKVTVAVPTVPAGPDPKNYTYEDLPLNVDVRPDVIDGKIKVFLILNYETFSASKSANRPVLRSVVVINQTVTLESGKPMTVSQSADAASDRKVTIEIKATILK